MGKICDVCQKGAMSGHNVSHSNRKSNRVWLPNTQRVRVNVGGAVRHMNVCTCVAARWSARCKIPARPVLFERKLRPIA